MESEKKVSIDATPLNDNNTERRKRKVPKVNKKKDAPEVPIFLKKTYHMIDACDGKTPEIAC